MIHPKPVPKMDSPIKKQKSKFQKWIKFIMIVILIASGRKVFITNSTVSGVLGQQMNVCDRKFRSETAIFEWSFLMKLLMNGRTVRIWPSFLTLHKNVSFLEKNTRFGHYMNIYENHESDIAFWIEKIVELNRSRLRCVIDMFFPHLLFTEHLPQPLFLQILRPKVNSENQYYFCKPNFTNWK